VDIVLARHGETEWNVGEVFRGRADIDLTIRDEYRPVHLASS
jgi:bisphosphoglycerate-dependent phosphoglycerate mutase